MFASQLLCGTGSSGLLLVGIQERSVFPRRLVAPASGDACAVRSTTDIRETALYTHLSVNVVRTGAAVLSTYR
jgi:hypothetical protein